MKKSCKGGEESSKFKNKLCVRLRIVEGKRRLKSRRKHLHTVQILMEREKVISDSVKLVVLLFV